MTYASPTQQASEQAADKKAIRPFRVSIPEEALTDLRRRIAATRWPDKETVSDESRRSTCDDSKARGLLGD